MACNQHRNLASAVLSALILIPIGSSAEPSPVPTTDLRFEVGQLSGRYQGTVETLLTTLAEMTELRFQIAPDLGAIPLDGELAELTPREALLKLLADFNTVITTDPDGGSMRVIVFGQRGTDDGVVAPVPPLTEPVVAQAGDAGIDTLPADLDPDLIEAFTVANEQPPLPPELAELFPDEPETPILPSHVQAQFDVAYDAPQVPVHLAPLFHVANHPPQQTLPQSFSPSAQIYPEALAPEWRVQFDAAYEEPGLDAPAP